jgi:tetratricopeptide (TPR) repeat protein
VSSVEPTGGSYGVREAAELVGLSPDRIRRFVRAGLVEARRGRHGKLQLSFRDLAFLRRVRELDRARIAPRRVHRALAHLRDRLRDGDLHAVSLAAAEGEVVVREGRTLWSPDSGQYVFDFQRNATAPTVVSLEAGTQGRRQGMSADAWYRLGCEFEGNDRRRAEEAYRLTLELDAEHADAHINLGCLEHEARHFESAEEHYRAALRVRDGDPTALFNLAVLLEDQERPSEAREAYEATLSADAACAEAHYNLARLCDQLGDATGVVRHLTAYKRLSGD